MYPLFKDIGTNIGTHALAIASLEREVVAVDAVFYNLALLSHRYVSFLWQCPLKETIYSDLQHWASIDL